MSRWDIKVDHQEYSENLCYQSTDNFQQKYILLPFSEVVNWEESNGDSLLEHMD